MVCLKVDADEEDSLNIHSRQLLTLAGPGDPQRSWPGIHTPCMDQAEMHADRHSAETTSYTCVIPFPIKQAEECGLGFCISERNLAL